MIPARGELNLNSFTVPESVMVFSASNLAKYLFSSASTFSSRALAPKKVDDPANGVCCCSQALNVRALCRLGIGKSGGDCGQSGTRGESQLNDLAHGKGAPFCIGKVFRNAHPLTIIIRGQQPR